MKASAPLRPSCPTKTVAVTGYTQLTVEVAPKRLELLHEVAPAAKEIALLVNPNNPLTESLIREMPVAARKLGLRLHILHASTVPELQRAFASMAEQRVRGLVVGSDAFFNGRSEELAQLATQHAFAAIYQYRTFVAAGGLMSYGGSITNIYRQVATYVARVLKGEKPADLPVQQETKIELIINLKTAKALGLIVSWPLLGRADEVIE
jgi:putative ABC transport system substrate-binding protein